jgi:hypothetical protein
MLLQVASISQLTVGLLSRQCGILNISQPYRPLRPAPLIDYTFFLVFYLSRLRCAFCFKSQHAFVVAFTAYRDISSYSVVHRRFRLVVKLETKRDGALYKGSVAMLIDVTEGHGRRRYVTSGTETVPTGYMIYPAIKVNEPRCCSPERVTIGFGRYTCGVLTCYNCPLLVTSSLLARHRALCKYVQNETKNDRLCGLVARVLGYRSGGPGSIPGTTKKKG